MSVDVRTRFDGSVPHVEPESFLDHAFPELLAASDNRVPGVDSLKLRSLRIEVVDRAWLLQREDDRVTIAPTQPGIPATGTPPAGDSPRRAAVILTPEQLSDLVNDQITPVGLFTGGSLDMPEGQIGHLLDWWLVLRSVLDNRPIHQAGDIDDLPADLSRSFRIDDDPIEMRAFLECAGYLHLKGVFTQAEMDAISADMDAVAPSYHPGDGRSWWATVADGTERVVRMQGFDEQSANAAALLQDPRFANLANITEDAHRHTGMEKNRLEALFKPIGVAHGISDVPWHTDCSLGRHSYECCSLTVGVSVTGAGPTSGQLRVVAGSHRALVWPSLLDTSALGLPEVALPTETGDLTIHLSCTLHMAQPPVTHERRVMYTTFGLPHRDADAGRAARNRLITTAREPASLNTTQPT